MGCLDESNQISEKMESENATTNNGHDESTQIDSNKNLISFASTSSSTSSNFSLEDLQILDCEEHDENHNENLSDSGSPTVQTMEHIETIPSNVSASKILTGPGNWSMASNESLFSIRMGGASFCHLDSFNPLFDLPYDSQFVDGKIHETDEEYSRGSSFLDEEDKGDHFSATSSSRSRSSSDSLVFPVLSGETENGDSPHPRGSLIGPVPQSPPQREPALEAWSEPKASEAEAKETTTNIAWTQWFPCFRYCGCCS